MSLCANMIDQVDPEIIDTGTGTMRIGADNPVFDNIGVRRSGRPTTSLDRASIRGVRGGSASAYSNLTGTP